MLASGLKAEKLGRIGASLAQGTSPPPPFLLLRARLNVVTYQIIVC
jgi:hypothetical protein